MPINEMSLDDRIILIKAYLAAFNSSKMPFEYGRTAQEYLETCNKLKALGYKWGDNLPHGDIKLLKGKQINLSIKHTSYVFDPDTYYVVWDNGNIGRLMFVNEDYWWKVEEEWATFEQRLLSFSPLDYDAINNEYVYDIENGKKLIDAYRHIYAETSAAMMIKVKEAKRKKLLQQLKKLDQDQELDEDDV